MLALLYSVVLCVSSSTFLAAWVAIEINMLSFVFLISFLKTWSYYSPAALYFCPQALGSLVFLITILLNKIIEARGSGVMILIAMALKIGAPPFHFWFLEIAIDLRATTFFILSTIQKIIPLFILSQLEQTTFMRILFGSWALLSTIIAAQTYWISKILASSSILTSVWALVVIKNFLLSLLFIFIYAMSLLFILKRINQKNIKSTLFSYSFTPSSGVIWITALFSMAGIPPTLGFSAKVIAILWGNSLFFPVVVVLLVSSGGFAIIYLRILIPFLLKGSRTSFLRPSLSEVNWIFPSLLLWGGMVLLL